jgi:outer membrane lipoprotein LolB
MRPARDARSWLSPAPGSWLLPMLRISLLLSCLNGCATLLPPAATGEAGAKPEVWRGRFALSVAATAAAPEQNSTGRFILTAARDSTELELVSPFGATLASARSDRNGAVLTTADGKTFNARSPEELTEQVIGWRVPVDRLPAWLRGELETVLERAPGDAGTPRPVRGTDRGWTVRFDQWGTRQPLRLTASFPERAVLRLIIDDL